jgi:hypothetical protein
MAAPVRACYHGADRILLCSDPGDVASGGDYRGGRHRWHPVDPLEGGRRGAGHLAGERSGLRLRRRIGSRLAYDENLAGAGLEPGGKGMRLASSCLENRRQIPGVWRCYRSAVGCGRLEEGDPPWATFCYAIRSDEKG